MRIVVASSSAHRQALYREAIEGLGHRAITANGGIECLTQLRETSAALLLLEAPLLWGGCDGVLDVVQSEWNGKLPVILIAVGSGSIDWFQLSRFHVDDFLFRTPTPQEIERAIQNLVGEQCAAERSDHANKRRGEAGRSPSLPRLSAAASVAGDPHIAWKNGDSALPGEIWVG